MASLHNHLYLTVLALSVAVSSKLGGYRSENKALNVSSDRAMLELAKLDKIDINLSADEVRNLYNIYHYIEYLTIVKNKENSSSLMWQQLNRCYKTESADVEDFSIIAKLPALYESTPSERKISVFEKAAIVHSDWSVGDWLKSQLAFVYSSNKAKNYNGYNIQAIIDQKLVSWFSTSDISPGLIKLSGSVKSVSHTIGDARTLTRLQYVKVYPTNLTFRFPNNPQISEADRDPAVKRDSLDTKDLPWD